ncbi:hypothetical protein NEHOM01_0254 [Nematocida homosporus]|uniref:uncharacterized protein n=1 Tax=Nematocida homosporus TaxID=1912981 RepID=UPI00221F90FA|nr:uncharacterized protein NEHOM01_0254 [Nematocida homosporus]KAI5184579.1 hypothetical protein NEHOM01_0254 [Nematocida homosporus]
MKAVTKNIMVFQRISSYQYRKSQHKQVGLWLKLVVGVCLLILVGQISGVGDTSSKSNKSKLMQPKTSTASDTSASSGVSDLSSGSNSSRSMQPKTSTASDTSASSGISSGSNSSGRSSGSTSSGVSSGSTSSSASTKSSRTPPTLEELAGFDLTWAKERLQSGQTKPVGGPVASQTGQPQEASAINPQSSGLQPADADLDFYKELNFKPQCLDQVKRVAFILGVLFDPTSADKALVYLKKAEVPDVIMMYAALNQHATTPSQPAIAPASSASATTPAAVPSQPATTQPTPPVTAPTSTQPASAAGPAPSQPTTPPTTPTQPAPATTPAAGPSQPAAQPATTQPTPLAPATQSTPLTPTQPTPPATTPTTPAAGLNKSTPTSINPNHETFIEQFALCIDQLINISMLGMFERACLDRENYARFARTEVPADEPFDLLCKASIITTKADFDILRSTPIINYIHPLNTRLYRAGFNYKYDNVSRTFVVVKHNADPNARPNIKNLCRVGRFTFESAVRLIHPAQDQYTIMASDEDFDKFLGIVMLYQRSPTYRKRFKRSPNKKIKTLEEYDALRQRQRENPGKEALGRLTKRK